MSTDFLAQLSKDRVIAVVRAPEIPDAAALCEALRAGGIHWIEFTRTTPASLPISAARWPTVRTASARAR